MAVALHITGNLAADPEYRTTGTGKSVATFSIANSTSKFNRDTKQWEQGEATFIRCVAWGPLADNMGASHLSKGMRVVADGTLKQHSYQTGDGQERTGLEMTVSDIGPSLLKSAWVSSATTA